MTKGRRKGANRGSGERRARKRQLLSPDDGPWSLDYSLVDYEPSFGWPEPYEPSFGTLAAFLARLNTRSLTEVTTMRRANTANAHHDVEAEELEQAAQDRWGYLYEAYGLELAPWSNPLLMTLTYCMRYGDPRRVWAIHDTGRRTIYPLWWDPRHEVWGRDEKVRTLGACTECCDHDRD